MNVEHDTERQRFVVRTPAGNADLTYQEPGSGILDLQHTFVPRDSRGEGIAESLAEAAFEHARSNGMRVRPTCTFVKSWLESHPEYDDIVEQ
jgi:uncharacterized protein